MTSDANEKRRLVSDSFGRSAHLYDDAPFFHLFGRKLIDLADIPEGSSVLDIATGRGAVLFPAALRVGPSGHVTGIDIAEPMVQATAVAARSNGLENVDLRQMDAENLTFPDASFDFVLCGFALWFIPNLDRALSEVLRVLRPGSTFAASTWASNGPIQPKYGQLARAYSIANPALGSHSLESLDQLESALREAGFQDVRLTAEVGTVVYPTEEDWWFGRAALPKLMAGELEAEVEERLKEETFSMLQEFKKADGIHDSRKANLALALAPS